MKEAIGNSAIFTFAIIFISIVMMVFLSSLNYSKAFKIKNRIVGIIENYESGYIRDNRNEIDEEIEAFLRDAGYRINAENNSCPTRNGKKALNSTYNYRYCIYEYDSTRGKYYGVITYMYFDIPLIGSNLELAVQGETRTYFEEVKYNG